MIEKKFAFKDSNRKNYIGDCFKMQLQNEMGSFEKSYGVVVENKEDDNVKGQPTWHFDCTGVGYLGFTGVVKLEKYIGNIYDTPSLIKKYSLLR